MATDYYIDLDAGNDSTNDGTSAVKTNGDGPWLTFNKYTASARAVGDKAIVRRGTTETASADMTFLTSGGRLNPITLEADFDDAFGDQVDLSATGTATLAWGSKTITFSADVSGVLATADWIYVSGEDNRVYAYEVETVATTTVTLYLPYKGDEAGSGKTMFNMQAAPIWNVGMGGYETNLDSDENWVIQGIAFHSADWAGPFEHDSTVGTVIRDCIFQGNGSGDTGLQMNGGEMFMSKCRTANAQIGISFQTGKITCKNCLFDGANLNGGIGLRPLGTNDPAYSGFFEECEYKNYKSADVIGTGTDGSAYFHFRNCTFGADVAEVGSYVGEDRQNDIGSEDHDNVVGVNKNYREFDTAVGTPILQSEGTIVRGGGGTTSIKVTPSALLGTLHFTKVKVFDFPIYASTDSKTYTVYFKTEATANWTADPTAAEFYIELDAWYDATNKFRKITKSTGTCDFNGTTDWVALTVTVAPAIAGVAYLRCYYGKAKEASSNIFYCDPKIEVT